MPAVTTFFFVSSWHIKHGPTLRADVGLFLRGNPEYENHAVWGLVFRDIGCAYICIERARGDRGDIYDYIGV